MQTSKITYITKKNTASILDGTNYYFYSFELFISIIFPTDIRSK